MINMRWYTLCISFFLSMFNTKNNTQIPLKTSISASSGTAVLEDWYEALLPSWTYTSPIRSTIEKLDTQGRVIKREIIDITGRTWTIISITRWVESCPFSWDATTHTSTHASFDQWDIISCNLTAGILDEIQTRIATVENDKLNISDYSKWFNISMTSKLSAWSPWTKIWTFWSWESERSLITIFWGDWYGSGSDSFGSKVEISLYIWNGSGANTNMNGTWKSDLGSACPISLVRVSKVSDYEWDVWVYHAWTYINNSIVEVKTSWTFVPSFTWGSAPNVWVWVYDITKYTPTVDIGSITENTSVNIAKTYYLSYDQVAWTNKKIKGTNLFTPEFFDWSDWDVTISTSVTLVRDMYYNNLTIASWGILDPNWFKIFCTWTFTIASWGIVRRNGNNWGNGSSYPWNPWAGWAALNQWSINWESWAAWSGGGSASPGWNWISVNPSYQSLPWANWWYSNNWSIAGWTWWTSTQWWVYNFFYSPITYIANRLFPAFWWTPNSTPFKSSWTAGGGAWWNQWSWNTTAGGWGWGNGWVIAIFARIFVNGWTIEAKWGNGWAWGWPTWAWIASGGGGWWNWWTLITITKSYTSTGTVNLSWGSGWASWGSGWQAWANWSTWLHINISI